LVGHFVTGQITNDQFEVRLSRHCCDGALDVLRAEAWYLYDDLTSDHLIGKDRTWLRCLATLPASGQRSK
jgi:hypothetical protein